MISKDLVLKNLTRKKRVDKRKNYNRKCVLKNIIIVGYAGSGKSTLSRFFANQGYKVIEISDFVKECYILNASNKESLLEYANSFFENGNFLEFVKRATKDLKQKDGFVFVGPRTREEIEYLKTQYKIDLIIGVRCEKSIRYFRRKQQKKSQENINYEYRDEIELSWGNDKVFDLCDYIFDNSYCPENEMLFVISRLCGKKE